MIGVNDIVICIFFICLRTGIQGKTTNKNMIVKMKEGRHDYFKK